MDIGSIQYRYSYMGFHTKSLETFKKTLDLSLEFRPR